MCVGTVFRLAPEELFLWSLQALDDLKETSEPKVEDYASFFSDLQNDMFDMIEGNPEEGDALRPAAIVTTVVLMVLIAYGRYPYHGIGCNLILQIPSPIYSDVSSRFMDISEHLLAEKSFRRYAREYMESDEFLSDEIEEMLEALPQETENEGVEVEKKGKQLTNRQLMILFDLFLDAGFSSDYTNVSAYAKLLSLVSGNSPGSIRQKMRMEIDYSDESVKEDLEYLAELLEPIKPEMARKMRNLTDE